MNGALISVVITTYNEENNIEKCVKSILDQSYKNLEIIVIDDGSEDGTWNILQKLSKQYGIHILKQKNMGVSVARNRGIHEANGTWIVFCDADDFYFPLAIEQLEFAASRYKCDVVQGGLKRSNTENKENCIKILPSKIVEHLLLNYNTILDHNKYSWIDPHIRFSIHGPYGKLIKRDFIIQNGIYFSEELKLGEDLLFFLKLLSLTNEIVIVTRDVYNVTMNANSVTRKFNPELPDAADKFVYAAIDFLKKNKLYTELRWDLNYQIYMHFSIAVNRYYMHPENKNGYIKKVVEFKRFASKDIYSTCFGFMRQYVPKKTTWIGLSLLKWRMFCLYFFLQDFKRRIGDIE